MVCQGIFQVLTEDEDTVTVFSVLETVDGAGVSISGAHSIPQESITLRRKMLFYGDDGDDDGEAFPEPAPTPPNRLAPHFSNN